MNVHGYEVRQAVPGVHDGGSSIIADGDVEGRGVVIEKGVVDRGLDEEVDVADHTTTVVPKLVVCDRLKLSYKYRT